jgi:aerobic carbon-monoxide dehydrogenase large subunit
MNGSIQGTAKSRREDFRLITGTGQYVDDIKVAGLLHAAFVRSPLAHATLHEIDTSTAAAMPGVAAIYVAADIALKPRKGFAEVHDGFARPPLSTDVVRFVGEAIAVVLAESRDQAVDAAASVSPNFEALPVVVQPEAALRDDAPVLFPMLGTNLAYLTAYGGAEDAMSGAEVIVRGRFVNQRLAAVPMEPHAILVVPDEDGQHLKVWISNQAPFAVRTALAIALNLEERQIQVIAPDVGGGFGAKFGAISEHLVVAAAARKLRRPVRWVETRSENMMNMVHGRGQVQHVELGATRDGRLIGLRARVIADAGSYPAVGAFLPYFTGQMASGVYRIPRIDYEARSAATNTSPLGAYRGAGRPEAIAMIERAMDILAAELKIDPVELRRRNLIPKDAFPYQTPGGYTYDSGNYELVLQEVLRLAGYESLRREQHNRRLQGDAQLLGIGIGLYVEVTGTGSLAEWGSVEMKPDGEVIISCGTTSSGQGHETTLAQIAAEELQVPYDRVRVIQSDTALVARGGGTAGSRSTQLGGSAVHLAAAAVKAKAMRIVAHMLEVSVDDLVARVGRFQVLGVPGASMGWDEVLAAAWNPDRLPDGLEPGLKMDADFVQVSPSFPFGAHLCVVEVDVTTGATKVLRHIAVDDCGRVVNPLIAEGQIHGGTAQGIAQALFEEVVFDNDGNPLASTLLDYSIPCSADIPDIETACTVTPSPLNPLGAKGIGESGTVGSTPAVQNAVIDALAHLGVRHIDMPLTSERVWQAIQQAGKHGA